MIIMKTKSYPVKMKRYILLILIIPLLFSSCIDVIDLEVPEGRQRLVVEGRVTDLLELQTVILKNSAPYFSNTELAMVAGAEVSVIDNDGEVIVLEESSDGVYQKEFQGVGGQSYSLLIRLKDGTEYVSVPEKLVAAPAIDSIYYKFQKKSIFNPEEGYKVGIYFSDPPGQRMYYRWTFHLNEELIRDLFYYSESRYYDGLEDIDLDFNYVVQKGDKVKVRQLSVSERYYRYLDILRMQVYNTGSQFDTPPAPVIGNVHKAGDREDYAFGYFSVTGVAMAEMEIKEEQQ